MTTALQKVLLAAELLERGSKVVASLRKNGDTTAADVVQKACNQFARSVARRAANAMASSRRARKARRDRFGRLM